MTMPNVPTVQPGEIPPPGYPMLTRMISRALFPDKEAQTMGCPHCKQAISIEKTKADEEWPLTWVVSKPHPLIPNMKVVRMFIERGGVEIYSVSADNQTGMRNFIPMTWVRLTEEAMPLDVFIELIEAAESDDDPDDPDPGDPGDPGGPDPAPAPVPLPANGTAQ